jgi:putative DNA methylase
MNMTEPTAAFTTEGHTPVLIEDWLPIRELGIESVRERQAVSAFPPLSFLHVWWARAPLAAANGVVLNAVLPLWSDDFPDVVHGLREALDRIRSRRIDLTGGSSLPDKDLYRYWILWLCGVKGDAVAAQSAYEAARQSGHRIPNPFTWPQAYKSKPDVEDLNVLHALLEHRWGRLPRIIDPTAGGGTIPFTSMRYGLPTWANDLNPVAVGVLDATLRASSAFGEGLISDIEKWGKVLIERCEHELESYYPSGEGERVTTYVFANAVRCPRTGGTVPLAPNWWLDKGGDKVAVHARPRWGEDGSPSHIEFEIATGPSFDFDPDNGTVARGDAVSPWDGLVVDGEHIKAEAQAGRMFPVMYAVVTKRPKPGGRGERRAYRAPTPMDLDAVEAADAAFRDRAAGFAAADVLPTEEIPFGSKTSEPHRYGYTSWVDCFTPRQLLAHATFIEQWRELREEVVEALGVDRAREVMTLLAMMQHKALNYNARLSAWHPTRASMANVFDRHDFAFKWTFGEFEGARDLWKFCLNQLLYSYRGRGSFEGVAKLVQPPTSRGSLLAETLTHPVPGPVTISSGSASDLQDVTTGSIECVNIDPPYYDNVQYAELADFFYPWEKRTLGLLHPERFAEDLTNKDDEAVANVARFADAGRRKKELATFDYQQKMQAIFAECHRVLVDDGVMVVWFTHKRAEAWDTLATAMMEAGFTIEASWPVSTQSETSMHHAKKNSAKSTIMLVCRKRQSLDQDETFFEDIEVELRQAARSAVEKFEREVGVGGVDLQLATYGPTLSVISRNWPVLSSEPDETGRSRRLRPEEALDVARQEVARLRMQRLVGKDATFDPATDFWLMCWETFQAREFPYDEARKLALGVGHDVDEAIKAGLLKKKSGNVELVDPTTRGRALRRQVDDGGRFEQLVDALHFMLVTYRDDKLAAARTWLSDSGYGSEQRFLDVVQAAVNAVPRVRTKKGLSLEEAVLLEDAVVALFGDEISLPVEAEGQIEAEQMTLGG